MIGRESRCIVLDGMVPPQLAADAHAELEQMAQDGTLGRGAPNARKRGGAGEEMLKRSCVVLNDRASAEQ